MVIYAKPTEWVGKQKTGKEANMGGKYIYLKSRIKKHILRIIEYEC